MDGTLEATTFYCHLECNGIWVRTKKVNYL